MKKIIAWVGIVILAGFYVAALVGALLGNNSLFAAALYATFVVPALIFALIRLYNWTHRNGAVDKAEADRMMKETETERSEE